MENDQSAQPKRHIKLLLFLFGLTILVVALLSIARFGGINKQSSQTAVPTTQNFTNPFAQEETNPFATESGYQNPFEKTSGEQEYKNPFGNLR